MILIILGSIAVLYHLHIIVFDKNKIKDDTGRIKKLEKMISENDEHVKNLDENLVKLREEVGRLTKQSDDAIVDKNKAIAKQVTAERKINQEIEARAKIQGELANLREKRANSIRRESKSVENSTKDAKRILDLELEIKTLKEGKQQGYIELTIKQYLAKKIGMSVPFVTRIGKWSLRRSL